MFLPITITVPATFLPRLKREAAKRRVSVSGLLRESFEYFTKAAAEIYSPQEFRQIMERDRLDPGFRRELDRRLK